MTPPGDPGAGRSRRARACAPAAAKGAVRQLRLRARRRWAVQAHDGARHRTAGRAIVVGDPVCGSRRRRARHGRRPPHQCAAWPRSWPPPIDAAVAEGPPIDRLFHAMAAVGASDLHLSVGMPPLVRKDGRMQPLEERRAAARSPPRCGAAHSRSCRRRTPASSRRRHDTDFAYEIAGLARFRANIFVDRKGPGAVFRVIPSKILTAEQLGLSPHILQLCNLTKGLVLVTGPTGSGKSTTLCAMVDYINRTSRRSHHHDRGSDRVRAREPAAA